MLIIHETGDKNDRVQYMKKKSYLVMMLLLSNFVLTIVFAEEVTRTNVQIQKILSISTERPEASKMQGLVRMQVNSESWGTTTCRGNAVDVQYLDYHLLTNIYKSVQLNKSIDVTVESTLRPDGGEVCQATQIKLNI